MLRFIHSEGFVLALQSYPDAVQGVKNLAEFADVYFVTSPWHSSRHWVFERTEWLCRYFGQTQGRKVIHTSHKHMVRGDMMIEDRADVLDKWFLENGDEKLPHAVLMNRSYNRNEEIDELWTRVQNWDEIVTVVWEAFG